MSDGLVDLLVEDADWTAELPELDALAQGAAMLALEAAELALDYTRRHIRPASLVSYIDARNHRSIALAKRLGATRDDAAQRHDAEDVVYRHAVAA